MLKVDFLLLRISMFQLIQFLTFSCYFELHNKGITSKLSRMRLQPTTCIWNINSSRFHNNTSLIGRARYHLKSILCNTFSSTNTPRVSSKTIALCSILWWRHYCQEHFTQRNWKFLQPFPSSQPNPTKHVWFRSCKFCQETCRVTLRWQLLPRCRTFFLPEEPSRWRKVSWIVIGASRALCNWGSARPPLRNRDPENVNWMHVFWEELPPK